jgi:hypothetical protein
MLCCALIVSFVAQPLALLAALWARLTGQTLPTVSASRSHVTALPILVLAAELAFLGAAGAAFASSAASHANSAGFLGVPHLCSAARDLFAPVFR